MNIAESMGAVARAAIDAANEIAAKAPQAVGSGSFTVSKDNVLGAAKIIQTQADSQRDTLREKSRDLRISAPGDDQVSTRVAAAWNDRLVFDEDSYAIRIQLYVDSLAKLVQQLVDCAKAYGYNDEEIAAAFGARSA
jgi:hypothetical protein